MLPTQWGFADDQDGFQGTEMPVQGGEVAGPEKIDWVVHIISGRKLWELAFHLSGPYLWGQLAVHGCPRAVDETDEIFGYYKAILAR